MNKNIFEELQEKKQALVVLAKKAADFEWINSVRQKEILDNIDNDVLTIGVIGQMKCGKSTFINSFIFGDDILPAATTPMTAALSVITYGESEKIVAEFYSNNEWEEQKLMASHSLDEAGGDLLKESKIKAAKEFVEKSKDLGSSINSYLGTQKEDAIEKLIDYVGADGKYTPITKSVTIYSTEEYLKGVKIVDTPGFNDPVVSREERTKDFLRNADVVLLMLYAGRPFDATDREILFKNVRECGTGKVIVAINKYDIPYENGDSIDDIKEYVTSEIQKASRESGDSTMTDILHNLDPIPLSAEMALLSQLPMSKIAKDEAYQHAWKRSCDIFGISNQSHMREESRIENLTSAVKKLIETEKEEIIFKKSLNVIDAAGNKKKADIDKIIFTSKGLFDNLSIPDDELIEKKEKLDRADRRLRRKFDLLEGDLNLVFSEMIWKGTIELEDDVSKACSDMKKELDDWKTFSKDKKLKTKLERIERRLIKETIKRRVRNLNDETKRKVKSTVDGFFRETMDILRKFSPDLDYRDVIKGITQKIDLNIDKSVFSIENTDKENPFGWIDVAYVLTTVAGGAIGAAALCGAETLITGYTHNKKKQTFEEEINARNDNFNPKPYLEIINNHRDKILKDINESLMIELINPMKGQIDEILSETTDKEAKKRKAQNDLEAAKKEMEIIVSQIEEINAMRRLI